MYDNDDDFSYCGLYDDEDFTASEQCCACSGGLAGGTFAPTTTPAPSTPAPSSAPTMTPYPTAMPCVNDDSTTGVYGVDCETLEHLGSSYCANYDDEDFTASLQCCACGGYLGKTFAPTATPPPSTSAPSVTPAPSSAPTTTPVPSIYCGCNRTLVVAVDSGYYPASTHWTLTMGDAPDSCVDVRRAWRAVEAASGGPYINHDTLYTQEITICEDVTYTIEIECCWDDYGYFYLELDGSRFRENEEYTQHYSVEFTSLATTFFLRGSLTFGGISYETALANEAVFVAAIAWMCDVEEATVSVTISQAARRLAKAGRRLDDGGVTVAYDVAVEDGVDVMTIIDRVEGYTEAAIDATFILVADDAGVADVFETLVTTEAGTPTVTDPYGPYSFSYKYTMPPTLSPAPSLSPAPTVSLTEPPSMTPAPTVTFAPTRSPCEYDQPTDDAPPYCRVDDVSVCWGNSRRFLEVAGRRPFDTIAWPDGFWGFNAVFGDIDHDGDLDMVVGDWDGKLYFYRNVGSAMRPEYVAVEGRKSPFDGIDVGQHAAPVLVDLDGDGDLDLIVGENKGQLFFYNNSGGSVARATFTPRSDGTGDKSIFAGYTVLDGETELDYIPILVDLDNDGRSGVCRRI
jgi:hypothetical protein